MGRLTTMKSIFTTIGAVLAIALAAAVPAWATTFSSPTLIYVASGVTDSGTSSDVLYATSVHCSNVSGVNATVRVFFFFNGASKGSNTAVFGHAFTHTVSTQNTSFAEAIVNTGVIFQGLVTVYSTQSAVFCTAMIVDPSLSAPEGIDLHMVRYNANPGTVE
jgi:hypothetical protein